MNSDTIRIRTTPDGSDKYIKFTLEQDFDSLDILSLNITQEEVYKRFCSDYGVVVGRVNLNGGLGVPNAKVSIFIPIDEEDKLDPRILGLYPYEVVNGKNDEGVRYNVLPKGSLTNECHTPVGTFPDKREILDNDIVKKIYDKYYKFTATTNQSGDFMFFGVPLGNHIVHVDADISDIGYLSQRPYDSISQGTPQRFFESPTKYKGGKNLDNLVQIKTVNVGVNVQPFWGDLEQCEIGITRLDIDLNHTIRPCAIFMGGIFGDQDKNSVNKNCYPRRKMGNLCDQATSEGTIEMIRKTPDGEIEEFNVDGGRVIDENGAWAYQIPMNLDYIVTNEYGELVFSDDPNKGVPTRARVRFRIGMDQTGGEGRLRTRAKYLVPNDPVKVNQQQNLFDDGINSPNQSEIINSFYEFNENTPDYNFTDLFWNKIYSVKSYIPRFQRRIPLNNVGTRRMMAIKDVDGCVGDKNPFPFNKVDTTFNPLFFIVCLIMMIIALIVTLINSVVLPIINIIITVVKYIIEVWNSLMRTLCKVARKKFLRIRPFKAILGWTCDLIIDTDDWLIPCISIQCPADGNDIYAPGCWGQGMDELERKNSGADISTSYEKLIDCVAVQLADALDVFKFDFYNDWVNGSLYSFLLKYKKSRRRREKFCEYNCSDFEGGIDANNDGSPDNKCSTNILMDTCFPNGDKSQKEDKSITINEGLVKKYNDELYYASSTHDLNFKLYATDVICLGSVFECDWQGIPKINDYLVPTTYNIPPQLPEEGVTGQFQIGSGDGLFFNIDCLGVRSNSRQVLNVRHICEFGVELDEDRLEINEIGVESGTKKDGVIGINDMDLDSGSRPKYFRDVFLGLNMPYESIVNSNTVIKNDIFNVNLPYESNFNIAIIGDNKNNGDYGFADLKHNTQINNGIDYLKFRGYRSGEMTNNGVLDYEQSNIEGILGLFPDKGISNSFGQFNNSFYFYFGILPGKTGLDKMNNNFFTTCDNIISEVFKADIKTQSSTIHCNINPTGGSDSFSGNNGVADITISNGVAPYSYTISGPNGYDNIGNSEDGIISLIDLEVGEYFIEITDYNGDIITKVFNINKTPSVFGSATSKNTSIGVNDGQIIITSVNGGNGKYWYKLFDSDGKQVNGDGFNYISNLPLVIDNLPPDDDFVTHDDFLYPENPNLSESDDTPRGYTIVLYDTCGDKYIITNLSITQGQQLTVKPAIPNPNYNENIPENEETNPKFLWKTNIECLNGSGGKIGLMVEGGEPPYTVLIQRWDGENNGVPIIGYESYTPIVDNLTAGLYHWWVKDSTTDNDPDLDPDDPNYEPNLEGWDRYGTILIEESPNAIPLFISYIDEEDEDLCGKPEGEIKIRAYTEHTENLVGNTAVGGGAILQYNVNSESVVVNGESNLVWVDANGWGFSPPSEGYQNNTEITINIPTDVIGQLSNCNSEEDDSCGLLLRFRNSNNTCYSGILHFDYEDVKGTSLPALTQGDSITPLGCAYNVSGLQISDTTYRFPVNINHLNNAGNNNEPDYSQTPYSITYQVGVQYGTNPYNLSSNITTQINYNGQVIEGIIPNNLLNFIGGNLQPPSNIRILVLSVSSEYCERNIATNPIQNCESLGGGVHINRYIIKN